MTVPQKMPQIYILHNDTAYDYRGSLEFEEIERIIFSNEFIHKANEATYKKNYDGITFKNFLYHPKFKLKRAFEEDMGFEGNLRRGIKKYSTQFFMIVELFAKTFGVRRVVASEENILPFCCLMMVLPFILFLVAICVENFLKMRKKLALEDKKKND